MVPNQRLDGIYRIKKNLNDVVFVKDLCDVYIQIIMIGYRYHLRMKHRKNEQSVKFKP